MKIDKAGIAFIFLFAAGCSPGVDPETSLTNSPGSNEIPTSPGGINNPGSSGNGLGPGSSNPDTIPSDDCFESGSNQQYFDESVWALFDNSCLGCHGNTAMNTGRFTLSRNGDAETSYSLSVSYIESTGGDLLYRKPSGENTNHMGGNLFTRDSEPYSTLTTFVERVNATCVTSATPEPSPVATVRPNPTALPTQPPSEPQPSLSPSPSNSPGPVATPIPTIRPSNSPIAPEPPPSATATPVAQTPEPQPTNRPEASPIPTVNPNIIDSFSCRDNVEAEFTQEFWPVIQSNTCVNCHSNPLINTSSFELSSNNAASNNFALVQSYIENFDGHNLYLKPSGALEHAGGGELLSIGSQDFERIQVYVERVNWLAGNCSDPQPSTTPEPTLTPEPTSTVTPVPTPIQTTPPTPVPSIAPRPSVPPPPGGSGIFDSVGVLSLEQTLRKAAYLFAGREPTQNEINEVNADGESGFRAVVRQLMRGPGFEAFLRESANDQFLTMKFATDPTSAVELIDLRYGGLYDAGNSNPERRRETNFAIASEPTQYIVHVVTQDRPYTEILTADYHLLNPWSNRAFNRDGNGPRFNNPNDRNEWREGPITWYNDFERFDALSGFSQMPTAGILTSPAFLARYPTTETNRNRARARWIAYFFLGIDIERLVNRAQDPDELRDATNPGDSSTSCYGCHSVMDPIAGTLQSWDGKAAFRTRWGFDIFSDNYVINGAFQEGDTWYRDNLIAPGFGTTQMPTVGDSYKAIAGPYQDGTQWLAEQIVSSELFLSGTAKFWFKGVFGRDPAFSPSSYESEMIDHFAQVFSESNFDLKAMLIEMVLTPYFRADSVTDLRPEQVQELEDIGVGKLLSPEQLDRKLLALFGESWRAQRYDRNELLEEYYFIYGGIDSDDLTVRPHELNTLMSSVVMRMANELSCSIVYNEFSQSAGQRRYFGSVTPSTVPSFYSGYDNMSSRYRDDVVNSLTVNETAIRQTLQTLHKVLLNESLDINDAEIDASLALWTEVWRYRLDNNSSSALYHNGSGTSSDEHCFVSNAEDMAFGINQEINRGALFSSIRSEYGHFYNPEQTLRAWIAVMTYLLSDYRFIHE